MVVSGGGMSTKSVGGSDGSEVEAGALVSCDRYFRIRFDFDVDSLFDRSIRKKIKKASSAVVLIIW